MSKPSYWTCATSMLFGGKQIGPVFTSRALAADRARQENKYGESRGRNVKAVPCDEHGQVDWSRVMKVRSR